MMADVKVYNKDIKPKAEEKPKVAKKEVVVPDWKTQKRGMIINHEVKNFTKTFRDSSTTLILSALGLVAALSWNDAIKTSIDTLFPDKSNLVYKFYIAIVVTAISVCITYFISKLKPKTC